MLYFITGNKDKFSEAKEILGDVEQLDIDLPEIQEIDSRKVIEAKLKAAREHYDGEFIVEDVSLAFECLNGLPGPLIKWFLKTIGNNGLAELAGKYGNNKAEARVSIGYLDTRGSISFFEGTNLGKVGRFRFWLGANLSTGRIR